MKEHKSFLENLIRSILEFVASRGVAFDLVSEASESIASHRGTIGRSGYCRIVAVVYDRMTLFVPICISSLAFGVILFCLGLWGDGSIY